MARISQRITPFLWFDHQAEEAARFYTSIFPNSEITSVSRHTPEVSQASGLPEGSVLTVAFRLDGHEFVALNGGPVFKFTEAVSFVVNCETQEEIDRYWNKLSADGDPKAQQCGWLKDRFGLSWQIVPTELGRLISGPDPERARRVLKAMLDMKKLDLEVLQRA